DLSQPLHPGHRPAPGPPRHRQQHHARPGARRLFAAQPRGGVGARWWGGKPAWVTLQEHGGRAATMFWPGSEAPVAGQHPAQWLTYDGEVTGAQRVDQVLAWLDQPRRPGLVTLYFDKVDHAGHRHGPHSPEAREAEAGVDASLARLLAGLDARGLRGAVDLVVVSDHGMAAVQPGQRVYIDDWLAEDGLSI